MKYLLLYLILGLSASPDVIPIGMVSVKVEIGVKLRFYNSPFENMPSKSVEMIFDSSTHSIAIKDRHLSVDWLLPEDLSLDHAVFYLSCLDQKVGWLQVVVNEQTGKMLWLKEDDNLHYLTWADFFKEMSAIDRADPTANPIYTKPDTLSKQIPYTGNDFFAVRQIHGDWMEIYSPAMADSTVGVYHRISSGWIRWRDDDKLLIGYYSKD